MCGGKSEGVASAAAVDLLLQRPSVRAAAQSGHFCKGGRSPQFEDVLLLLVAGEDLPAGVGQAQGLLAVVGRAVAQTLGVLVGRELTRFQDAVQVVPGPEERRRRTWDRATGHLWRALS